MRRAIVVLLAVLASGLGGAAAADAQTIATEPAVSQISGWDGWLAWSSLDTTTNRYSLTVWHDGTTTSPDVPTRTVPFDVDLGPDRRGRPTAVYSRCSRDTALRQSGLPIWALSEGCDIVALELGRRGASERRVRAASSRRYAEFTPTIWRGNVAFARAAERGRAARDFDADIRTAAITSADSRRLPHGAIGEGSSYTNRLDLRGDQLVAGWVTEDSRSCKYVSSDGSVDVTDSALTYEVFTVEASSAKLRRLRRTCDVDDKLTLRQPTFLAGRKLLAVGEAGLFPQTSPFQALRLNARVPLDPVGIGGSPRAVSVTSLTSTQVVIASYTDDTNSTVEIGLYPVP